MKRMNIAKSFLGIIFLVSCEHVTSPLFTNTYPSIYPDYVGVTIPATIAPLNFTMLGDGIESIDVVVKANEGGELHESGIDFSFSPKEWRKILESNRGDSIMVTVCVKKEKKWIQYRDFPLYISKDSIDYGLVYRLVAPGYEVYSKMGIYQRELRSYTQKTLFENTLITGSCVNCHSFKKASPDYSSLHVRGEKGATIMTINGVPEFLDTRTESTLSNFVYPYWHPSGKYIAYSVNNTRQAFHMGKDERVEVIDMASDIIVYQPNTKRILTNSLLATKSFETFPAFSADGRTLFFCSADQKAIPEEYKEVKYSLCSIAFDPEKGTFGDHIDTLISTKSMNKSISFPRPSYDGKYLMFTLSDYGNFPIWHKEADLWLFNLTNKSLKRLDEVNSNDTESYHSWSSNSRWFVFSSRRDGGLYTRLYIASINEDGFVGKPFLLPQKEPLTYYDESVYSYNVPEFVSSPVKWNLREMENGLTSNKRTHVTIQK